MMQCALLCFWAQQISHYLNTPNKRPNSRDAAASEKPQPKMSAINFSQFANWFLSDQKDKSFNLE